MIDQKSERRDPSRINACADKYDSTFDVGSSFDEQDAGFTLTGIRATTC